MHEDSIERKKRVAAWLALREARQAMEGMVEEAARTNNTHPMYGNLKKWLPIVTAAEQHVGNVVADLDPSQWMDIRPIADKLFRLGQRKADEIAPKLERAYSMLIEG